MNLSRNSLKLRFLGLISVIFVFAALANLPKAYASESVLLDTKTGNDYVQLIYPHYEFTPTVSGVLDSIDLAFSIKDPTLNFVATIEYPTFNPTDCVSDTILGTSGNPLDSNSIITHVVFQGAQCGLLAGHRYGIDFGALKANFVGGGVWGNAGPGGNVIGGYGIYYGHPLPSCSDGVQNQNETGIDTGGVCDASSALLDNLTGKGFAREMVPHWSFTPDKSGTLTSIAGYFSDQQIYGVRTMGAHLEDANGIGLDCNATDTVNLNPLRLHGILSGWNDFTGQDCHLTAGTGYRMRLDNVQTGGVWVSGLDSFIPNVFYGGIPDAPTCTSNCFSNVLFLPGVMGSRLYEESGSTEKELWVSSNDSNQSDLVLDNSGRSVNSEIYTKDDTQNNGEVDETGIVSDVYGFNMYKSFINDLRKWKNDDNIIADYAFIPYDWRLSLNDIITNGFVSSGNNLSYNKSQDFSESFILKKLEELQKSSRTGKVTIIAHSNGGLVAKALIQKLKDTNNPLYNQIDKVIFVAVPQVGTPDAVADLLHGSEVGPWGLIMSNSRSRQLSENMPAIYNLLPSAGYFTTVNPGFAVDQIASFENTPFFTPQTSQYGVYVSNELEQKNFILGTDDRAKPSFDDTVDPNIGNSNLYSQAEAVHQILDSWQPSSNTKVVQIAGWGEETLAGLDYKAYVGDVLGNQYLSYKLRMVIDGDGVVVVPSALWMPTSSNIERWWVDLNKLNENATFLGLQHRNILENTNLLNFINSEIKNSNFVDSENIIINNQPSINFITPSLHFTLHSPLTLGIVDSQGRYTGQDPVTKQIRQEIPNVTFKQIGEVQFISAPVGTSYTVKLDGYQQGTFSLDVDKQEGDIITASTSFQGIPSLTSTLDTINILPTSDISNINLQIDQNGDGVTDVSLPSKLGGAVTMPKYIFPGFLQPINDTAHQVGLTASVFKVGSTVPVKFQLKKLDGTITQAASLPVWLTPVKGSSMTAAVDETIYTDLATSGSTFKWDATSQQYIYNWSTKGLTAGYWYKISVKLDDGYIYSVNIGLR